MTDYTQWKLADLEAELDIQAAAHDKAGTARREIAEEILRRERSLKVRARLDLMSEAEKDALRAELDK